MIQPMYVNIKHDRGAGFKSTLQHKAGKLLWWKGETAEGTFIPKSVSGMLQNMQRTVTFCGALSVIIDCMISEIMPRVSFAKAYPFFLFLEK